MSDNKAVTKKTKESERHVDAVLRALDILDCFELRNEIPLKEIIDRTGLNRSRVMRLAGTLEHRGYLVKSADANAYLLGSRLLTLGKVYERKADLIALSRPLLKELARSSGESALLYVREGLKRMVLAREESEATIRFSLEEGQRMDLPHGAGGKVIAAWSPPDVPELLLQPESLIKLTDISITDAAKLKTELERVMAEGLSVSRGERVDEAGSICAPVFDGSDNFIGALGIAGPVSRFTEQSIPHLVILVREASRRLSGLLGWAEASSPLRAQEE